MDDSQSHVLHTQMSSAALLILPLVPLTTVGACKSLINCIDAVDRNNADVIPCKVSYVDDSINLNVDESTIPSDPIVQSVGNQQVTSFVEVAVEVQRINPNVNSNFRTLVAIPYLMGVNKLLFLYGLLKEELTRIPIWVKLHDVPIHVFEEDGISSNAKFIEADLVDVVTIGIPSLSEDDFTKETIRVEYEWRAAPVVITSLMMVSKRWVKRRRGKVSPKSTNDGLTGPSVKHNVRYEPKATTSATKKGNYLCGYYIATTPM
ncbi:hypothetical protein Tco_0898479 [Tanacetum coccineum]